MSKLKLALRFGAAIILAAGAMTMVLPAVGVGGELTPDEIFQKAREKYASLTSYSDEGKTVASLNGTTITTTFKIKLARPGFYLVEWAQTSGSFFVTTKTGAGAVWSAGAGDFLDMGMGKQKQTNQEMALASATGISGGAAATIPGTFFKLNWGDQLGLPVADEKQQPGEKIGDVDCYVFTSELNARTRTLWIGRTDFLIQQVKTVTSAEALKAALAEAAKSHPEIPAPPLVSALQGITSIETHANIIVNQKSSPADFAR